MQETQETGDMSLISGSGRSPGGGNSNPLQYSCLANPMDRGAWQPTPIFLPGESHGQRSLVSYNPWGHKELNKIEQLTLSLLIHERCLTPYTRPRNLCWNRFAQFLLVTSYWISHNLHKLNMYIMVLISFSTKPAHLPVFPFLEK